MTALLTCLLLACPVQDIVDQPFETDWNVHISNLRVPDPTRPDLEPNLGYTSLWRSIYGNRRSPELAENGFAIEPFSYSDDEALLTAQRREPRIRSARWITISQPFYDQPSFTVPATSLDPQTASFVWNHQLEQVDAPWQSSTAYTLAPTSTPRDYVPNTIVEEKDEDWTHEAQNSNLFMTFAVVVLASILLVVIVFMPK